MARCGCFINIERRRGASLREQPLTRRFSLLESLTLLQVLYSLSRRILASGGASRAADEVAVRQFLDEWNRVGTLRPMSSTCPRKGLYCWSSAAGALLRVYVSIGKPWGTSGSERCSGTTVSGRGASGRNTPSEHPTSAPARIFVAGVFDIVAGALLFVHGDTGKRGGTSGSGRCSGAAGSGRSASGRDAPIEHPNIRSHDGFRCWSLFHC
jgi:hypothetical protein